MSRSKCTTGRSKSSTSLPHFFHLSFQTSNQLCGSPCNQALLYALSSKNSKPPANVHLQLLHRFQDPANGALIACLRQLWDLRRVAFSLVYLPGDGEPFNRFITDLQEFVQEHSLRLERIHTRVHAAADSWSRKYTRQRDARNELVSWEVEYGVYDTPQFVDRW